MRIIAVAFVAIPIFTLAQAAITYRASDVKYCPEIKGPRSFLFTIHDRFVNDVQEFQGNATMHKDFTDDNTFLVEVHKVLPKKMMHLITLRGKGGCTTMNKQGGAAWLMVAKMANVPNPNKCPIKQANYALDGYLPISPEQIPLLRMVPKGKYKLLIMQNDTSGVMDFCATYIFEKL